MFTSLGLDGAAFASRMPANKLTQMETEIFFDIAHGTPSAIMEFLFIRNKLIQVWLTEPSVELTAEKAQAAVILPQAGGLVWLVCLSVCMCVCLSVCVYVCNLHVCMCMCIVCLYVCMHVCMYHHVCLSL